jgi:hypothetical protein
MMENRFLKRLRKKAKKGLRGWPIATIAFYGPNLSQATKVTVGIVPSENAEVKELRDWKIEHGDVRADRNVPHFRSATMKTIKFEDALKDYLEEMKRTGWYTKAYKAFVEANILKLVMERRPVADPNATMMDLFDATEMIEIVREAEAMTEAFMKSEIERMARKFYHRLRQIC